MAAVTELDFAHGIFLFFFGLVAGAYGALVGAGGGFVIVPMLLLVFNLPSNIAAGTSLVAVFFTGASGAISYALQRRIDYHTALRFAVASMPGAVLGAYVSSLVSGPVFTILFGTLLVLLAIFMTVRPREAELAALEESEAVAPTKRWFVRRQVIDASGKSFHYQYHQPLGIGLSALLGFVTSMLGIGGGIVYVPMMVYLFSVPVYVAVATATLILVLSSAVGSVSHILFGNVLFLFSVILGAGVVLGAQVGARLSARIQGPWIIRLLSLALIVAGARLVMRGLQGG